MRSQLAPPAMFASSSMRGGALTAYARFCICALGVTSHALLLGVLLEDSNRGRGSLRKRVASDGSQDAAQ